MDTTFISNRDYSTKYAYDEIMKLYSRCLAVEGNFVLLWHNSNADRDRMVQKNVYVRVLKSIKN